MIRLDGASLGPADVERVAAGDLDVHLADLDRVAASAAHADAAAARRPVYGRTTGVGANRTVALDPDRDLHAAAAALLRSHATAAGPLRDPGRVRAAVAVRLNQLLAGGSGISPGTVTALARLLRSGAVPPVRELGGVGTGDLTVFATVGLTLVGELVPAVGPAPEPVAIGLRDVLPLLSSNAAAVADAALAVAALARLADQALEVAAGTFLAVDGNAEAFAEPVERATPFPGARGVCRAMRRLVADAPPPARIQDPFALRTLPQVHGALVDAGAAGTDVVTRMANAPSENPLFLPPWEVAHHGGFEATSLTLSMDTLALAVLAAGRLSAARLGMLCAPDLTGLPPFLGAHPGASGVLMLEYVAGSALGELATRAAPAGLNAVRLSLGMEEDASFAGLAARQALEAAAAFRTVVAAEAVAAVRALRMRGRAPDPGSPALAGLAALAARLPDDVDDRDLTPDVAAAEDHLTTAAWAGP